MRKLKCKKDTSGYLYSNSTNDSNLLWFNFPVLSTSHSTYVLYDCGASHKFVHEGFIKRQKESNPQIKSRKRSFIKITTAKSMDRLTRTESWLTLEMGGYKYSGWFIHYDLLLYNLILGKDWMAMTPHHMDHRRNILYLGNTTDRWSYSVYGLPYGVMPYGVLGNNSVASTMENSEYPVSPNLLDQSKVGGPVLKQVIGQFGGLFDELTGYSEQIGRAHV